MRRKRVNVCFVVLFYVYASDAKYTANLANDSHALFLNRDNDGTGNITQS